MKKTVWWRITTWKNKTLRRITAFCVPLSFLSQAALYVWAGYRYRVEKVEVTP